MYVHCKKCHHEWECTGIDDRICNWCGGGSVILESETPLEKIVNSLIFIKIKGNKKEK